MPFDDTTELLFSIGANTDDAEGNITRFRSLMEKDWDDLTAEFGEWSQKIFGSLQTVQGAMTAGIATIGAAAVAVGGFLVEEAHKYEEYVEQVESGSKRTGIAAEDMSKLQFAAKMTGTSLDSLTRGLSFFEVAVVKANQGSAQQAKVFQQLGITQAQLAAGEKDVLPLLGQVMDRFQGLSSNTEKAAIARELFSRGGAELQDFLRLGSSGLKAMADEATRLGVVIGEKDIVAMKEHKAAQAELKASFEAFAVTLGAKVLPLLTYFTTSMVALVDTIKQGGLTSGMFFELWGGNIELARQRLEGLVAMIAGEGGSGGGLNLGSATKQATSDFHGFSNILEEVKDKIAGAGTETEKMVQELAKVQERIARAGEEFRKLQTEGKLGTEAARRESQAFLTLVQDLPKLAESLQQKIWNKLLDEAEKYHDQVDAAEDDLRKRIDATQEKTLEDQIRLSDESVDALRAKYAKEGLITGTMEKLLADLKLAAEHKIENEKTEAFNRELIALQSHLGKMVAAEMTSIQRLKFEHDQELADLQHRELEETRLYREGSQERLAIEAFFQMQRGALNKKFENDLNTLQNSQGWQGVLGAKFGSLLKQDEAAWKQWSQSATQAQQMVKLSLVALDEMGKQAFDHMAQGMGAGIASSIVYSKSIGEAMRSALASTLESLAAESLTQAIYATAIGFLRLAQYDYAGASAAFTAAAEFGLVGGAAAIAGRAIAPSQGGAGGAGGVGGAALGTPAAQLAARQANAQSGFNSPGTAAGIGGPHVTVNVMGHVFGVNGVQELASALNDAVLNKDVQLTATNTKTGVVVQQ